MAPDVASHIARLHYVDGLSKQEIARRTGISRFKVARLLDAARAEGIIEIRIADADGGRHDAARALEQAFELGLAVVVAGDELAALGQAAADVLPDLVGHGGRLGVAWGRTLSATSAALPVVALEASVVQICGAVAGLEPGVRPDGLAVRFADRLGGTAYTLSAPAIAAPATSRALRAHEAVAPTIARWSDLTLALVGIGAGAQLPAAPRAAAGHLLVHVFDVNGRLLAWPGAKQALAMPVEDLRRTRLMAVAGGADKHEAVLGALRTGLVDVLVTDERTAEHALTHAR
jgi:DNA-binding transcriptional regulator LsrR (DeoR family)